MQGKSKDFHKFIDNRTLKTPTFEVPQMIQYNQITQLISELLYRHDCVIVPGFGGFVSRSHSAGFNKGNQLLFPPAKHILFNRNLIHNDGLLMTALMERNAISFEEATKLTEEYRQYIQSLLSAKKRFELQNIGLLYIDGENSLRFEAKADMNFLFDAFGFEPVTATELPAEAEKPVHKPVFEDRVAVAEVPLVPRPKKSYARMAALAIGIPAVMVVLLLAATSKPMQPIMQSSVNPFYTPEKTYTPNHNPERKAFIIADVEKVSFLADANGYAAFTLSDRGRVMIANTNDSMLRPDKTLVARPSVKSNLSLSGKFQVVLGCFGVRENAERLVNELRATQVNAGISGVNAKGLHVVSCGSFNSKQEAVNVLDSIRQRYPNAWIMAQ